MIATITFIIILGVLVLVHELGHFVAARRNGIKASEFGLGFPPRALGVQFLKKKKNQKGRWRFIWGKKDGDDENEIEDLEKIRQNEEEKGTIYSINWLPIGGFVKIKGEDGGSPDDPNSFSAKSAWIKIKVLAAGVMMNFILAWVLISLVFILGAPQAIDPEGGDFQDSKIKISDIAENSPASNSGIKIGDEISKKQTNYLGEDVQISNVKSVQDFIAANQGKEISLSILRGEKKEIIKITPRENSPVGEGPLGVSLAQVALIKYSVPQAFWEGLKTTLGLIKEIILAIFNILGNLFSGKKVGADVAGPVGIAMMTKDVAALGLVYIMQFAALLSINLGIINILPIPALDGGRILSVLIAKIKGSPVSQKLEQAFHSVGFFLLIALLMLITLKDVWRFVQ